MNSVSFHKLGPADLQEVHALRELYSEVFQEEALAVGGGYLKRLLSNKMVLFFVAQKENRVIGGSTAYLLPSIYGNYNELYMYDMAVATAFQRQGIGTGLLGFIKEYCRAEHIKSLFVQADTVDIHARNFYMKNGGIEEDVRHYDFWI